MDARESAIERVVVAIRKANDTLDAHLRGGRQQWPEFGDEGYAGAVVGNRALAGGIRNDRKDNPLAGVGSNVDRGPAVDRHNRANDKTVNSGHSIMTDRIFLLACLLIAMAISAGVTARVMDELRIERKVIVISQ